MTDFIPFSTPDRMVTATDDIPIQLFSRSDDISLEYNDTVILIFTPGSLSIHVIQELKAAGEYIRNTTTVNIIDNDRK